MAIANRVESVVGTKEDAGGKIMLHDHIAVYPVSGWWKSHTGQRRMTDKGRYALAISITAEGQDVDLYSEISAELAARVAAAIEVDAAG